MSKFEQYKLEVRPSPIDTRDWQAEEIYKLVATKTVDYRKDLKKVRDQANQGSCAAMAAACMKEWQELKDDKNDNYMSPQFIYNLRANASSGMFPRDLMKILQKQGVVEEAFYPYGQHEPITNDLLNKAKNYVIENYARVDTIEGLQQALTKNGICNIAVPVYNHGPRMWHKKEGDVLRGGHMMAVVGDTGNSFIIRNSWGDDWGDEGYCYFPYADWGKHWEVWTTIDADSREPDFKYQWQLWLHKVKRFFQVKQHIWMPVLFGIIAIVLITISVIQKVKELRVE